MNFMYQSTLISEIIRYEIEDSLFLSLFNFLEKTKLDMLLILIMKKKFKKALKSRNQKNDIIT